MLEFEGLSSDSLQPSVVVRAEKPFPSIFCITVRAPFARLGANQGKRPRSAHVTRQPKPGAVGRVAFTFAFPRLPPSPHRQHSAHLSLPLTSSLLIPNDVSTLLRPGFVYEASGSKLWVLSD